MKDEGGKSPRGTASGMTRRTYDDMRRAAARAFLFIIHRSSFIVLFLLFPGCNQESNPTGFPAGTPVVRVLVLENRQQVTITAAEAPGVQVGRAADARRGDLPTGTDVALSYGPKGWVIRGTVPGGGEV